MTEFLTESLLNVTGGYLIRQVLVILWLTLAGLICNLCFIGNFKHSRLWAMLAAFPVGLAVYGAGGFALLLLGIPFNGISMAVLLTLVPAICLVFYIRKKSGFGDIRKDIKPFAVFALIAVMLAVICASGLLSVTIDNDSVYYYSVYPEVIAKEGRYLKYFDTFMTDVGQTSAVLNTLPFLYGFDNTFGIQHFLNIAFLSAFALFMLEELDSSKTAAALSVFFLAGSLPYIFISKWIMSNDYFMIYLCLIVFLTLKQAGEMPESGYEFMLFVFTAFLAMLRVEGVVVCAVLTLCFSSLNVSGKRLGAVFILPVFVFQAGFYAMLYLRMGVDPVYSFLDTGKALVTSGLIIALAVYVLFIRNRVLKLKFINERYRLLIILILILGNGAELVINSERYISNLLTIYRNIRLGHGWGFFGLFMVLAGIAVIIDLIKGRFKEIEITDLIWMSFILTIVAACWARGGVLRMGVGDSGNRIMMETVPLTVVVLAKKCYNSVARRGDTDH